MGICCVVVHKGLFFCSWRSILCCCKVISCGRKDLFDGMVVRMLGSSASGSHPLGFAGGCGATLGICESVLLFTVPRRGIAGLSWGP